MQMIQKVNGERGSNRYIISNCQTLENILQLFAMCRLSDWENPKVDFIPLFETISDLESAEAVMKGLFNNSRYRAHLESRKNKQTVMLGFSDGTKDGGYFMANWSIYKAKEALSGLATKYGISVAFLMVEEVHPQEEEGILMSFTLPWETLFRVMTFSLPSKDRQSALTLGHLILVNTI